MFDLLVHVHVIRSSMLSGPSCAGGTFTPSDNWTGNADASNKLAKKGISTLPYLEVVFRIHSPDTLPYFAIHSPIYIPHVNGPNQWARGS